MELGRNGAADHGVGPVIGLRLGPTPDRWPSAAAGLGLATVFLYLMTRMRPGLLGVVCWYAGRNLVPAAAAVLAVAGLVGSVSRRPFWTRARAAGFLGLAVLGLSGRLHETYPSSFDERPSRVRFRLPLNGPLQVVEGGPTLATNRNASVPSRRWAYELRAASRGRSHRADGTMLSDYYSYGMTALAPAAGRVVAVSDGEIDQPVGGERGGGGVFGVAAAGNHVVIRVGPRQYLWVCHLQPRSALVRVGTEVTEGEPIGRVGNSGDSRWPHVEVRLQDTANPVLAEGIPMRFAHYRTAVDAVVDFGSPVGGAVVEDAPPRDLTGP